MTSPDQIFSSSAAADPHPGAGTPQPKLSLVELLRRQASQGSDFARGLLRAGERAVTAGATAFRSLALLPSAALPAGGGNKMLQALPAHEQMLLEIDLLEWISQEELDRCAPWAGRKVRLHCRRLSGEERFRFTAAVPPPATKNPSGARLRIELQGLTGETSVVRLSARSFSGTFLDDQIRVPAEQLGYRVLLEQS